MVIIIDDDDAIFSFLRDSDRMFAMLLSLLQY